MVEGHKVSAHFTPSVEDGAGLCDGWFKCQHATVYNDPSMGPQLWNCLDCFHECVKPLSLPLFHCCDKVPQVRQFIARRVCLSLPFQRGEGPSPPRKGKRSSSNIWELRAHIWKHRQETRSELEMVCDL